MSTSVKIALFPRYDRSGASSRYRTYDHLSAFSKQFDCVRVYPLFTEAYLKLRYKLNVIAKLVTPYMYVRRVYSLLLTSSDTFLVIEKELFPYIPYSIERRFLDRFAGYSLDYDDAVYEYYRAASAPKIVRSLLGSKHESLLAGASLVSVGNYSIEKYAQQFSKLVKRVPTCVDHEKYALPASSCAVDLNFTKDNFIIGWIGTPNSEKNLDSVIPIIADFLEFNPEARLLLIGGGKDYAKDSESIVFVDWTEAAEARYLSLIDIGIMPLRDSAVERGKSGLKLIQYMASGKLAIASDVGENRYILKESFGHVLKESQDWAGPLKEMFDRREHLHKVGMEAQNYIKSEYSLLRWSEQYVVYVKDAATNSIENIVHHAK